VWVTHLAVRVIVVECRFLKLENALLSNLTLFVAELCLF